MDGPSDQPDPFAAGEPAREVALVVLGAAALSRRAFPTGTEADQLLLAPALVDCAPISAVASILALDRDLVWRLLPNWPPGSAGRPGIGGGRFRIL
jgi:hypothetical protein